MAWNRTIEAKFPGAIAIPELATRVRDHLERFGFTAENTLFANATCRDEVNQRAVELFGEIWGENFDLAGLGGYPSAGVTGFSAYAEHIPDRGRLFVLYGSHVGVNLGGEVGKVLRPGMTRETAACGALLGFMAKIRGNPAYRVAPDPLDREQNAMEEALLPHAGAILASTDPIIAGTEKTYEVIDRTIARILDRLEVWDPIVLLGGILINTPKENADAFAVRRAEVRNFDGVPGRVMEFGEVLAS